MVNTKFVDVSGVTKNEDTPKELTVTVNTAQPVAVPLEATEEGALDSTGVTIIVVCLVVVALAFGTFIYLSHCKAAVEQV